MLLSIIMCTLDARMYCKEWHMVLSRHIDIHNNQRTNRLLRSEVLLKNCILRVLRHLSVYSFQRWTCSTVWKYFGNLLICAAALQWCALPRSLYIIWCKTHEIAGRQMATHMCDILEKAMLATHLPCSVNSDLV